MRRVIIDTDPGVDDAFALMMAFKSPDIAVEAITTVGGNASLSHTTRNALRLLAYLGVDAPPVHAGSDAPLQGGYSHAYHVHGGDGLGVELPEPATRPAGTDAVGHIRERALASAGAIAIIAIGPLTNVAAAIEGRPDVARAIPEIIVMGGAVGVPGNVTPHAEFNFYEDAVAARAVMASGVPVTLVGLDVTRRVAIRREEAPCPFRGESRSARMANSLLASRFRDLDAADEFHLHDALAVAAAIDAGIVVCRTGAVSVTARGPERGRSVAAYGEGSVRVAVDVDACAALRLTRRLIEA